MNNKIHKLLTASLLAGVFAVAPVYAQDSGGDTGSGTSGSGTDAGDADAGAGADTGAGSDTGSGTSGSGTDAGDADVGAGADTGMDDDSDAGDGSATDPAQATTGTGSSTTSAIDMTPEQETEVRQIFVETAPEPVVVDFDVATGVVVPDTVTLQPLPPTVVEVVPDYADYQYFALEDGRIVIVEPTTLEVVYILEG